MAPKRRIGSLLSLLLGGLAQVTLGADPGKPLPLEALEPAFARHFSPNNGRSYTGAVVAVVKDGEVVLLRGYGFEDAAHRIPVDPNETLLPLGSITKTFAAVAIAQLLDEGRIQSVDDPVNRYLKRLPLPDNDGQAITIRMLGTHQAGFAERRMPFMRAGERRPVMDAAYLRDNLPAYIRPVNSGSVYSNFGIAVLGLMVEDITDEPFERYAARRIFAPAGMPHALFVAEARPYPRLAQTQVFYGDGTTAAVPQTWANHPLNLVPGAAAATGLDMARYMIALTGGNPSLGVAPLMTPASGALVMSRLGSSHPLVQGYGIAFMHNTWNGHVLAEHGGKTLGGTSYMTIVPELRLGIFVAATGEGSTRNQILQAFGIGRNAEPGPKGPVPPAPPLLSELRAIGLEALFGVYQPPIPTTARVTFEPSEYTGEYIGERRSSGSVTEWFGQLFRGGATRITGDRESLMTPRGRYVPIARDVFWKDPAGQPRRPSGWSDLLVFRRDADGRVVDATYLYTDVVYVKSNALVAPSGVIRWWPPLLLLLLTGLFGLIWARRSPGRLISILSAITVLALPVAYFGAWPKMTTEPQSFISIRPEDLVPFQLALNLLALLLLGILARAIQTLRIASTPPVSSSWRATLGVWHLRVLALAAVPTLWGMWHLSMIGWNIS